MGWFSAARARSMGIKTDAQFPFNSYITLRTLDLELCTHGSEQRERLLRHGRAHFIPFVACIRTYIFIGYDYAVLGLSVAV